MSLATPLGLYLVLAAAVAAVLLVALARARRLRALARLGTPAQVARLTASVSGIRRGLKALMVAAAVLLAVVAAARPGVPAEVTWQQRGIDVAVVMDFSASMLASDVSPSRLQRMIEEVEALLDGLGSDRVGVVVFAGGAAHFPLTHDHLAARSLFRGLGVRDLPPGSDLGAGIRVARCILRPGMAADPDCRRAGGRGAARDDTTASPWNQPELAERARAVVVFTDGEDTEGRARAEVENAALLGLEVFFVGVGTRSGELVPELDVRGKEIGWKKAADGSFITTRLDVDGLRALATIAGGPDRLLLARPDRFATAELLERLGRLEQGVIDEREVQAHHDVYHWFLFPAFMLLVMEACLSARRRRVVYSVMRPAPRTPGGRS